MEKTKKKAEMNDQNSVRFFRLLLCYMRNTINRTSPSKKKGDHEFLDLKKIVPHDKPERGDNDDTKII
jgi:hypothetical protein